MGTTKVLVTTSIPGILVFIICVVSVSSSRVTPPASVFRVFRIDIPVSMPVCRSVCTQWRKEAYVATILTAKENAQVAAQLTGSKQVLLGGQRDTTSSPFRWTEGPLGRANNSRGIVFWTGANASSGGRCTAAMYCNFDPIQPDAARSTETLLTMFASSGRWNDNAVGNINLDSCACRWDTVVFDVFPVSPTNVSLPYCRWCCATWRPGAYVATILSAEENAMVYAMLWSNWSYVALGASREPDSTSIESRRFRWTEGPLGAANSGLGTLLWTTKGDFTGGTCAPGMYCNFMAGIPNNFRGNQSQLAICGRNASSSLISTWEDATRTVTLFKGEGCACRHDLATQTESTSTSVIDFRTVTTSVSTDLSLTMVSYSTTSSIGGTSSHTFNWSCTTALSASRSLPPSFQNSGTGSMTAHTVCASSTASASATPSNSPSRWSKSPSMSHESRTATGWPGGSSINVMPLAAVVMGAATTAQWGGVLSGSSISATAVNRLVATQQLLYCRPLDGDGGGLLGLSLPGSGGAVRASARGAVAGNIVVLCAAAFCFLAAAAALAAVTKCSLRAAALRVALPSSLHPVWVAILQSTVAAAPPLLMPPYSGGGAIAVCALAAVVAGPLLLLCNLLYRVKQYLQLSVVPSLHSSAAPSSFPLMWKSLWTRTDRWTAVGGGAISVRCVWVLLLEYRALWYPAVDAAVLIAVSAAASVAVTAGSVPVCRAVAVAILLAYAVQLVVVGVAKPLLVPAARVVTIVTLALSCVSVTLQLPVMWGVERTDELLVLLTVVQLLALGVALVKIVFDVWNVQRALVRFVNELRSSFRKAHAAVPCYAVEVSFLEDPQAHAELLAFAMSNDDFVRDTGIGDVVSDTGDCRTASSECVGRECAAAQPVAGKQLSVVFGDRNNSGVKLFEELDAVNFESLRNGF